MNIRKSVRIFAGVGLALCLGLSLAPRVYSFYADAVQYIGSEFFLNNGQSQFVQSVNSTPTMSFQQLVAPGNAETAAVQISSASSASPIFRFMSSGHFLVDASTAAPTASANCAVNTGSSDMAGSVTISGGATAACTLTFANPYANVPFCVAADATVTTSTVQTGPTASTLVLTISSNRNDTLSWICIGR